MTILYRIRHGKPHYSIFLILIQIPMVDGIVYITGGTETACTHIMYLPIIFAAYVFGMRGSLSAAFLSGLTLGPLMPMNVTQGIMQEPLSWILRTAFFMLIGFVVSTLLYEIRKDHALILKSSYEHFATGLPNLNKLRNEMNALIARQASFTLVAFKIMNLNYINKYVDYVVEEKALMKVIEILSKYFERDTIYSVYTNELVVLMRNQDIKATCFRAEKFLENFKEPIQIDGFPVDLVFKSGAAAYPIHGDESHDLIKRLGRALDQESEDGSKIAVYDSSIAKRNKENYEIIVALYEAIKNDEFYIVYQPKICLKSFELMGVEALIRWTSKTKGTINPEEFIKLAEYTGMIPEITRWMIKNVIHQLKLWKDEGLPIKAAVNISSQDLKNDDMIQYTKQYMEQEQIEPELLELELTERTLVENERMVEKLMGQISRLGLKISLDDFGTGYNSLVRLVQLPIDYVKLDKFFIKNIEEEQNRPLIKGVIDTIHTLGKEVIAEGVETEQQMKILLNIGCDHIQGYYYSKPLPPEELKGFAQSISDAMR